MICPQCSTIPCTCFFWVICKLIAISKTHTCRVYLSSQIPSLSECIGAIYVIHTYFIIISNQYILRWQHLHPEHISCVIAYTLVVLLIIQLTTLVRELAIVQTSNISPINIIIINSNLGSVYPLPSIITWFKYYWDQPLDTQLSTMNLLKPTPNSTPISIWNIMIVNSTNSLTTMIFVTI